MIVLLDILFVLVSLMLIFMVVITPSQSEGLAGAFGGMGSDTFFGTKAHAHINRFTVFLAVAFMVLAIGIARWSKPAEGGGSVVTPPPTTSPAPPTDAPAPPPSTNP